MPIYAYKCSECGHSVEVLQKLSDPPQVDCPQCLKPALVKQLTAAGFQLKGSGWYVTDFRDKAAAKKDEATVPAKPGDSAAAPADKAGAKADTAAPPPSEKSEKAAPAPAPAPTPSPPAAGSGESS